MCPIKQPQNYPKRDKYKSEGSNPSLVTVRKFKLSPVKNSSHALIFVCSRYHFAVVLCVFLKKKNSTGNSNGHESTATRLKLLHFLASDPSWRTRDDLTCLGVAFVYMVENLTRKKVEPGDNAHGGGGCEGAKIERKKGEREGRGGSYWQASRDLFWPLFHCKFKRFSSSNASLSKVLLVPGFSFTIDAL